MKFTARHYCALAAAALIVLIYVIHVHRKSSETFSDPSMWRTEHHHAHELTQHHRRQQSLQRRNAARATGRAAERAHFGGDIQNWPSSGSFGNAADTLPYGNYAGGAGMYYPSGQPNSNTWTLG